MNPIEDISAAVLAQLKEIPGVKTCDDWGGEIEDLIKRTALLPGVFLAYQGARFAPPKMVGSKIADSVMEWAVVIIDRNLRAHDAAAGGCYKLIQQVRQRLIGFEVADGQLWPTTERLIFSGGGKLAYALGYTNDSRTA